MFARIGRCTSYGFGSTGIYYLQSKDLEVAHRSTVGWKNFAFLQAFRGVGEMLRPIFGDEEELTAEPLITPLHCARVLRGSYSYRSPALLRPKVLGLTKRSDISKRKSLKRLVS